MKKCPSCYIKHIPSECPGVTPVDKPIKRGCKSCFVMHLPSACVGLLAKNAVTVQPVQPVTVFRTERIAELTQPVVDKQYLPPVKFPNEGYYLSNEEIMRLADDRPSGAFKKALDDASARARPAIQKQQPFKKARDWTVSLPPVRGIRGERSHTQVQPGMLFRPDRIYIPDAPIVRVHGLYIGGKQLIAPDYLGKVGREIFAANEAANEAKKPLNDPSRPMLLDTCQRELSITLDVEFIEDGELHVCLFGKGVSC